MPGQVCLEGRSLVPEMVRMGHLPMENRYGLIVDTRVIQATGTVERETAIAMAEVLDSTHRVMLGNEYL